MDALRTPAQGRKPDPTVIGGGGCNPQGKPRVLGFPFLRTQNLALSTASWCGDQKLRNYHGVCSWGGGTPTPPPKPGISEKKATMECHFNSPSTMKFHSKYKPCLGSTKYAHRQVHRHQKRDDFTVSEILLAKKKRKEGRKEGNQEDLFPENFS